MKHAVVLGGGAGTRLWPMSRQVLPKHLLPLAPGGGTLLGAAVRRGAVVTDRVTIVTAESQREQTQAIAPSAQIIGEPVGRNTAAAVGLAAAVIDRADPDAVLVILPADQHVANEDALTGVLAAGLTAAASGEAIGTVGITPMRPETGYGYLEVAGRAVPGQVTPVVRFVEKPDRARAEEYLASGRFLWNAGMFFVTAKRLLAELDAHLPKTGAAVREIAAGANADELYPTLQSISIDHAVMERAPKVFTVATPPDLGWDDVGSWGAMSALRPPDSAGNVTAGQVAAVASTGNIVISDDDTLIATYGVSDLVIVKSGDAVLVLPKAHAQDVRKIVEALSATGLARYL